MALFYLGAAAIHTISIPSRTGSVSTIELTSFSAID
jgi:hypothetical protein